MTPDGISEILVRGNRTEAGPTVPPDGLYMTKLWYREPVGLGDRPGGINSMAQKKRAGFKRKKPDWSRPAMRIGALLVTILLIIGAIVLVVYRDKLNLDSLKRYITYRNLEKNDAGQTTEFNYTQDASNAFASLDGTLLLCSDTALQLYSNSGLLYIDEQVKMSQPVITTCGPYAVAYDVGETISMLSTTKRWYRPIPAHRAVICSQYA